MFFSATLSCQPLLQRLLVGGFNSEKQWHISQECDLKIALFIQNSKKNLKSKRTPLIHWFCTISFTPLWLTSFNKFHQKNHWNHRTETLPKNPGPRSQWPGAHHLEANLDNTSLQTSKKSKDGRSSLPKTHVICSAREGGDTGSFFVYSFIRWKTTWKSSLYTVGFFWGVIRLFIETTWSNHSVSTRWQSMEMAPAASGPCCPGCKNKRTPMCGDFSRSDFPILNHVFFGFSAMWVSLDSFNFACEFFQIIGS